MKKFFLVPLFPICSCHSPFSFLEVQEQSRGHCCERNCQHSHKYNHWLNHWRSQWHSCHCVQVSPSIKIAFEKQEIIDFLFIFHVNNEIGRRKIEDVFHGLIKLDMKNLVDPPLQEKHSDTYISIMFIQVTWRINVIPQT